MTRKHERIRSAQVSGSRTRSIARRLTLKYNALLLVAAILSIIPFFSPARAQNDQWKLYFRNSQGDEFYYDTQSVKQNDKDSLTGFGSFIRVDIRGSSARADGPIKGFSDRVEIDCSKMFYRRIESEVIRSDGTTYASHPSREWQPVGQDSSFMSLCEIVCAKAGRRRHERSIP
jgi:hypothetical protein